MREIASLWCSGGATCLVFKQYSIVLNFKSLSCFLFQNSPILFDFVLKLWDWVTQLLLQFQKNSHFPEVLTKNSVSSASFIPEMFNFHFPCVPATHLGLHWPFKTTHLLRPRPALKGHLGRQIMQLRQRFLEMKFIILLAVAVAVRVLNPNFSTQ